MTHYNLVSAAAATDQAAGASLEHSSCATSTMPARALPHTVPAPGGGHRRRRGSGVPRPALLGDERAHLPCSVRRTPRIITRTTLRRAELPACRRVWRAARRMLGSTGDKWHGDTWLTAAASLGAWPSPAQGPAERRDRPAHALMGGTLSGGRRGKACRMGRVCHGKPRAGGGPLHQPARARVAGQD